MKMIPMWMARRLFDPRASLVAVAPLIAASLLTACADVERTSPSAERTPVIPFRHDGYLVFHHGNDPGNTVIDTIRIEIAATDSARARGLMQRSELPPRSGMLFLFDREEPQSFWMANTPLALDMFFADGDSQIVAVRKYTRPFSPESVQSGVPARYVIETRAGYADSRGITEGVWVRWWREGG